MEKRQLVNLLHHFASSTSQEAAEVMALRTEYPYSQVLQVLSAKVSKDHNFESHQQLLQAAAVYCTDRSVLKEIISTAFVSIVTSDQAEVIEEQKEQKADVVTKPLNTFSNTQKIIDSIDYADEVLLDLKKLNELKLNFENVAAGVHVPMEDAQEVPVKRSPGRPKKKTEASQENLIESIKSSKKKIEPENSTTKEQIAIIDQFIKAQPSITSKIKAETGSASQSNDLAEVKSGEFSDTIVSETLAEILIRQGKKEKAIEVFRKLIWKFPQKKAYFAAQIEELKK